MASFMAFIDASKHMILYRNISEARILQIYKILATKHHYDIKWLNFEF